MGAGAFRSLTQVRRTVLLAEKPRLCICSGERFPVAPGEKPMTPLISSWNRRILFFTGQRALFQDGTSFSLRFPSYFLSGARPAGMLRRPGHRKITDSPGLCPVSYGEPRRQLNSHNGKEYLPFRGSTRRRKCRACQGRTDAVRSGRRNRYRQRGVNENVYHGFCRENRRSLLLPDCVR